MISIFLAFINGFMSVLLTLYEFLYYYFLWICGIGGRYPKVKDIWWDRSGWEYLAYLGGLLMFLSWPCVLCILQIGPSKVWFLISLTFWGIFISLLFMTAKGPVGARRRYKYFCVGKTPDYERLFVGILPIPMMLSAQNKGAYAVLAEVLFMVLLLILAPAFINTCCYQYAYENGWNYYSMPEKTGEVVLLSEDANEVSPVDFLHYSFATISTVGYGNIAPRSIQAQLLFISQIFWGWLYLVALLPAIWSSIRQKDNYRPALHQSTMFKGQWIQTAITTGLKQLIDKQQATGEWKSKLSPDILASAFAYRALKNSQDSFTICNPQMFEQLKLWCKEQISVQEEQQLKTIVSLCIDDDGLHNNIITLFGSDNDLTESTIRVLLWMSILFCEPSDKVSKVAIDFKLPSVEEWERRYGKHWATYALVAELLKAHLLEDNERVRSIGKALKDRRTDSFSWYGDNLLTSICILALGKCDIESNPRCAAITVLNEQLSNSGEGLPLVANLDIWHTALTIDLFCSAEMSHSPIIEDAEKWLTKMFNCNVYNGWSWSSDSNMLCIDSTSAALEALRYLSTNDTTVQRVKKLAQETIASTRGIGSLAEFEWPTFIEKNMPLHPCPIISARCLKHVVMQPDEKRKLAQALIAKV
ncbi:two pore domain potassium channel family protein, partial [Candidatus Pacearchaeota archaeon]|nr:two pore domain potassium channel family protein [Candidatus Pacearchaeota archaeon]